MIYKKIKFRRSRLLLIISLYIKLLIIYYNLRPKQINKYIYNKKGTAYQNESTCIIIT